MAYMDQQKKAKIAAALKAVVPANWKYSLAVRSHSTIVMTINSAPVDLLAHVEAARKAIYPNEQLSPIGKNWTVNMHYLPHQFEGDTLQVMERIKAALNTDNHDRSDVQSDYFDVGHYVDLSIGRWDKPFEVKAK